MVSFRAVHGCRRPADTDTDAGAFQNDNAYLYNHTNQSTNGYCYDYVDTCADADGNAQSNEDEYANADRNPHTSTDFDDAADTHTARDGYTLAQPNQACGDECALMGVPILCEAEPI